jgi:hypothetical protein
MTMILDFTLIMSTKQESVCELLSCEGTVELRTGRRQGLRGRNGLRNGCRLLAGHHSYSRKHSPRTLKSARG